MNPPPTTLDTPAWVAQGRQSSQTGDSARDAQLVTGDGVVLDVEAASLPIRSVAFFIDCLVWAAIDISLVILLFRLNFSDRSLMMMVIIGFIVFVVLLQPFLTEVLTNGRSVGKMVMRLRVVRDDGGPTMWRHAFVRALVGVCERVLTGCALAVPVMLLNRSGKRLGDMTAGTIVVYEPKMALPTVAPQMPPALADWAATADVARLPERVATLNNTVLARSRQQHTPALEQVLQQQAADTVKFVSPPPPAGTSAKQLLEAVMAIQYGLEDQRLQIRNERAATIRQRLSKLPFSQD